MKIKWPKKSSFKTFTCDMSTSHHTLLFESERWLTDWLSARSVQLWIRLIRAFCDIKAFLYILIGGFS